MKTRTLPETTWDGDDVSLAVWAAVGGRKAVDLHVDDAPEAAIARMREHAYDWAAACSELGISAGMDRALAVAAAWAGIATVATARRDAAIRRCLHAGAPLRGLGDATGLSHAAISRIRDRE